MALEIYKMRTVVRNGVTMQIAQKDFNPDTDKDPDDVKAPGPFVYEGEYTVPELKKLTVEQLKALPEYQNVDPSITKKGDLVSAIITVWEQADDDDEDEDDS